MTKEEKKQLFDELADLRIKEKEINDRIEEIKPIIYQEVDGLESGTPIDLESGKGSFTVSYTRKWTYPEYVTQLEKEYKKTKKKSEQVGDATYTESVMLKFSEAKVD
jgi:hypothetical protein